MSAVADAVYTDHPCGDVTTCDIARALCEGFTEVAAELLQGATETPNVDRVFSGRASADEWKAWTTFFRANARGCDACGGYTFDDPTECGHCGATLNP